MIGSHITLEDKKMLEAFIRGDVKKVKGAASFLKNLKSSFEPKKYRKRGDKKSIKSLKIELSYYVEEYVRWRDLHTCVTCGASFKRGERTLLHGGHYISRKHLATRWDEQNIHAQCASCNMKQAHDDPFVKGNYEKFLVDQYGEFIVDHLKQKSRKVFRPTRSWIESEIEIYKKALERERER